MNNMAFRLRLIKRVGGDMHPFDVLNAKCKIVFQHYTQVPGFADSVKHADGFSRICERLNVLFLRRAFDNTRSATQDCSDPSTAIGFSDCLARLSTDAEAILSGGRVLVVDIDFNFAVSGHSDGQLGKSLTSDLGLDDRIHLLRDHAYRSIIENLEGVVSNLTPGSELEALEDLNIEGINVRLSVRGMALIGLFSDGASRLSLLMKLEAKKRLEYQRGFKAVIHLRRGDICVFPFRGKYIAAWGDYRKRTNRAAIPEIVNTESEAVYPVYDIAPYSELLRDLSALKVASDTDVYILSDGFERGFRRIKEHSDKLGLNLTDLELIRQASIEMESRLLEDVGLINEMGFRSVTCILGESGEKFRSSVEAIASADIFLYSSGGFGKTVFNFFNFKDRALCIGPCTFASRDSDREKIKGHFLRGG